jgi:hypothetical protein
VPSVAGDEWGYWVGDRCVARCFADGRCEAVDERGFATGVPTAPPAPLPAAVTRPSPPATVVCPNFGIEATQLVARPSYSISGIEVTREEAHAALAGGSLVDDSDRWHLTAVGDAAFQRRFAADVTALPAEVRRKLHIQAYGSTEWPVELYRLPAGVSLRKPSPVRTAEQVGVVAGADYSPGNLRELINVVVGTNPAPAPRLKPPPAPISDPRGLPIDDTPAPVPSEPGTEMSAGLALVVAVAILVLNVIRRPT